MKLCRYGQNRLGLVDTEAGRIKDVSAALNILPAQKYPLPGHDLLIANLPKVRAAVKSLAPRARSVKIDSFSLLAPVANPGKIIGAPINYEDHVAESKADSQIAHGRAMEEAAIAKWGLFLKARSALIGPSQPVIVRRPHTSIENRNDHEVELVAVIGRRGTRIRRQDSMKFVCGYCIGLDMTLRGPQFAGMRKSIDTYAVLGPWFVTADEFGDPGDKDLSIRVNGELRQNGNTWDLIYDVPQLIEFASSYYTLEPGDLIYTGTPAGVGPVKGGDVMVAEISGIGRMSVKVKELPAG